MFDDDDSDDEAVGASVFHTPTPVGGFVPILAVPVNALLLLLAAC